MPRLVITPRRVLRNVAFLDDGSVSVEYFTPAEDLKASGVVVSHVVRIPTGASYDDEIDALIDRTTELLEDVLEDLPSLEALDLELDGDDDDEDDEPEDDDAADDAAGRGDQADASGGGSPGPAG